MTGERTSGAATPARARGERLILYALLGLLAVEAIFLIQGWRQHVWLADAAGAPLCRDFSVFWASGRMAGEGHALLAYDWPATHRFLLAAGQADGCTMPLFYPPSFLLWLIPFGAAPYAWAAAAWVAFTLTGFLAAVRLATPRPQALLMALAAPATLACLAVGQNGLLTAALAVAGLALLDRRPILAGLLLGLLAYKPQFGLMLPVALLASGRWKAVAGAAASLAAGAVAAGLAFGWSVYPLFLEAVRWAGDHIVAAGALAEFKQQSVHALAHQLGAGATAAWICQGLASIGAAVGVAWLWRGDAPWRCKAAGLLAAMFVATPYSGIYDFPVLAAAVILLAACGLRLGRLEGLCLAAVYLAPLAYGRAPLPIGPFACALLGLVVFRAARAPSPAVLQPIV